MSDDSPVKLCECGCGTPTLLSKETRSRTGAVKGQPLRFIKGHNARVNENLIAARQRVRKESRARLSPRRKKVISLYRDGLTLAEIAERLGVEEWTVVNDLRVMRAAGVEVGRRAIWVRTYVDAEVASEVERLWCDDHASIAEIADQFGWPWVKAHTVVQHLRRNGYDIRPRMGSPVELDPHDKRLVRSRFAKRVPSRELSPHRQVVLRLLEAVGRPLFTAEIAAFLHALSVPQKSLSGRLQAMRSKGLLASATVEKNRWGHPRNVWFVPFGAEQSRENLTLADAERETELTALIESQQDELKRGDWIDSEKGHWADKSIDAPLTPDGFTILDTLGEEDDALAELMEEAA